MLTPPHTTYCFTDVCDDIGDHVFDTSVAHQLLYNFLPIFCDMLFAPWALAFCSFCDLDFLAQGQTMTVLLSECILPLSSQKYKIDFD